MHWMTLANEADRDRARRELQDTSPHPTPRTPRRQVERRGRALRRPLVFVTRTPLSRHGYGRWQDRPIAGLVSRFGHGRGCWHAQDSFRSCRFLRCSFFRALFLMNSLWPTPAPGRRPALAAIPLSSSSRSRRFVGYCRPGVGGAIRHPRRTGSTGAAQPLRQEGQPVSAAAIQRRLRMDESHA